MVIIKVEEVYDQFIIGEVVFSLNPFNVPFFSNVTWHFESHDKKEYEIGSWVIVTRFNMSK